MAKHLRIYTKDLPEHGYAAQEYLADKIAHGVGTSYDRDPQHIEAQLKRTQETMAKLLVLMRLKGTISDAEMLDVVGMGDWETQQEKTSVKEEEY